MTILLISPTVDSNKRTNKGLMMPQLALYILQALTPGNHKVVLVEEETEKIDLDMDCDLVGISFMTANAPRAYELCKVFKERGKTVVLGGVHPTILPEEALQHADSVVIGEAEGVWEGLLIDFQNNSLKRKYHNPAPDLGKYNKKDFSRITKKRLYNLIPIMTTRGCPYNCDFCCVTNLFGKKIRHIPIENVIREIKDSGAKNFIFLDDNIIGHKKYAKELFTAIKPLNISWVGQASVSLIAEDDELLDLAADSGCKVLFFGLESVSVDQLKSFRKSITRIDELENALRKIRKAGIIVHASMIFGFDNDTWETFDKTVKFLIKNKVGTVSFNVLTPYPGTKTYEKLKASGRLITSNWKYYDHNTVVFKPVHMSAYDLQYGRIITRKKFYTIISILKRLRGNLRNPLIYLLTNLGHKRQIPFDFKHLASVEKEIFQFEDHKIINFNQNVRGLPQSASYAIKEKSNSSSSISNTHENY